MRKHGRWEPAAWVSARCVGTSLHSQTDAWCGGWSLSVPFSLLLPGLTAKVMGSGSAPAVSASPKHVFIDVTRGLEAERLTWAGIWEKAQAVESQRDSNPRPAAREPCYLMSPG